MQADERFGMPRGRGAPPKQQRAIETRDALLKGAATVFSRVSYAEARLRDISEESGISEGALYFHYGTKNEIACAVLSAQQERMTAVLTEVLADTENALRKLSRLAHGLGQLIADDVVVQAGIRLAGQPNAEVAATAHEPYFEWVRIACALIKEGIADGSIRKDVDVDGAAEFINSLFVGSQMLSGFADSWKSLPRRLKALESFWIEVLEAPEGRG